MIQINNLNNNIYKPLDIIYIMPFQKGNQYGKLRRGHIKSKGTLEKMSTSTKKRYELGEKFGFQKGHKINLGGNKSSWKKGHKPWNKDLKGFMSGENNPNWKGELPKCECGNILSTRNSKYCNDCKGEIISIKLRGKKGHPKIGGYVFPEGKEHPNWRGGSSLSNKRYSPSEWRKIRLKILERDNFTCKECGKTDKDIGISNICVDHIFPWRISKDSSDNNLQTLCRSCNVKKIKEENIWFK